MHQFVYLHLVINFEKGESHATTNDHVSHFVQKVLNQLDLVCYLGATSQTKKLSLIIDSQIRPYTITLAPPSLPIAP